MIVNYLVLFFFFFPFTLNLSLPSKEAYNLETSIRNKKNLPLSPNHLERRSQENIKGAGSVMGQILSHCQQMLATLNLYLLACGDPGPAPVSSPPVKETAFPHLEKVAQENTMWSRRQHHGRPNQKPRSPRGENEADKKTLQGTWRLHWNHILQRMARTYIKH